MKNGMNAAGMCCHTQWSEVLPGAVSILTEHRSARHAYYRAGSVLSAMNGEWRGSADEMHSARPGRDDTITIVGNDNGDSSRSHGQATSVSITRRNDRWKISDAGSSIITRSAIRADTSGRHAP